MNSTSRRRYVTQADIAREAGVSRPLVSLVLRNSPNVSDEKRERVLDVARRLGYIGSGIATSLAGNRKNLLIGYLAQNLQNQLFTGVFQSMESVLEPSGHRLLVMQGSLDPEEEDRMLRDLISFRPDAIVLAGYAGSTSALQAASNSLPIVSVTRRIEIPNVFSVLGDDELGASLATQHLIDLGHTEILHMHLPKSIPYDLRLQAYVATMEKNGLVPQLISGGITTDSGYNATMELFSARRPTAIFCGNDALALGTIDALQELGLRVPNDVSLVGYDNTDIIRRLDISSVDQQADKQGRLSAESVVRISNGWIPKMSFQELEPRLIVRGSSGALRK